MGRKAKGPARRPIKGFRPGKEPPVLRKRQAKAALGSDASWAQKKMVDVLGDKSPREVEALLLRWVRGLLAVTIVLGVLGIVLYRWSIVAGILVHLVTLAALILWYRLQNQRKQLLSITRSLDGRKGR